MNTPPFLLWTPWANRYDSKDCDQPGVYVLARFDAAPPMTVEPISEPVIYIGETCDQNLAKRWYQFNRSAFERKEGHSGGWTFCDKYCASAVAQAVPWLYVAAMPVLMKEPHRSAYIRHVERLLIWQFVQAFGALPACNSK